MTTMSATTGLFGGIGSWLARLLRPEAAAQEPLRGVHCLDRLLIMLVRGSGDVEPRRLLVDRLGLGEAEFRAQDPVTAGERVQLQLLLDAAEGVVVVNGAIVTVERGRGRLVFETDAAVRVRLESWIRKRSRTA